MTKFFFKFKKTYFWPISTIFGAKMFFKKNQVVMQLHNGFQHLGKIQRNLKIKFQENRQADVRREGWTDPISQDPFSYRQRASKYNCSSLAFKSQKKVQCWSNKKLFIIFSMQKISSIHQLIQQILGYHELNNHAHF